MDSENIIVFLIFEFYIGSSITGDFYCPEETWSQDFLWILRSEDAQVLDISGIIFAYEYILYNLVVHFELSLYYLQCLKQ